VTYSELTRKLRALGCVLKRQARGKPRDLAQAAGQPDLGDSEPSGDIPIGTLRVIMKQLEISREELDRG
jgi:predicted RNA binding protein YcfA (HicA-like mRNA interferase family)